MVIYHLYVFLSNLNNKPKIQNVANEVFNEVPLNSVGAKGNHIENFLAYVDQQKFCPNIYNSASSFWTRFPEKYGIGILGKFCCTSCYYLVSQEIYCGDNKTGLYKLCRYSYNSATRYIPQDTGGFIAGKFVQILDNILSYRLES